MYVYSSRGHRARNRRRLSCTTVDRSTLFSLEEFATASVRRGWCSCTHTSKKNPTVDMVWISGRCLLGVRIHTTQRPSGECFGMVSANVPFGGMDRSGSLLYLCQHTNVQFRLRHVMAVLISRKVLPLVIWQWVHWTTSKVSSLQIIFIVTNNDEENCKLTLRFLSHRSAWMDCAQSLKRCVQCCIPSIGLDGLCPR